MHAADAAARSDHRVLSYSFISASFFLHLRPFAKTTGDFLRIERVAETGRARNADPESSSLSHLAGHETNGATGTRPKDAADATMQWKLEVTPAHFTVGVDGRRLSEGGEGEVEQGMVLYNVRSGTQLHVRWVLEGG